MQKQHLVLIYYTVICSFIHFNLCRMKRLPVLLLLLWICSVFYVGIFLFVGGFLLVRLEVNRTSTCADVLPPGVDVKGDFCLKEPRFRRAVVLIIDALKADFTRYDPGNVSPRAFQNKLPVLDEMASTWPIQARLYTFRADPPTTTMQRIKGFTTGSLPTFIDVGNNFASSAILEDNLVHQLGQAGEWVKGAHEFFQRCRGSVLFRYDFNFVDSDTTYRFDFCKRRRIRFIGSTGY